MIFSGDFPKTYLSQPAVERSVSPIKHFRVLVSIVCTVVMILLGVSEIKSYVSPSVSSNLFIGTSHKSDVFHANIDITFPYMPCDVLGLNLRDSLENYINDYYGEVHKHRLDADGNDVGIESWTEKNALRSVLKDRVR